MVINAILIAVLLGIGYIWSTRGFFSGVLHLMCVIAGGAIAFALWEPCAAALLSVGNDFLGNIAWGAGLLIPFAVATGILTAGMNLVIRGNAKCDDVVNIAGGAVCGAGVGAITAGMVALSISMIRSSPALLGFTVVEYDKSGSLVRQSELWIPVDRLVASLYGQSSESVFSTSTPLARYYPDLPSRGHLMKSGPDETTLKFAVRPDDVALMGRYTVGESATLDVNSLVSDTFDPGRSQKIIGLDGEPLPPSQYQIEGYIINPKGGMREKKGQVVMGPGFLTLVCIDPQSGYTQAFQPFAMISQSKADRPGAGRWRFDGPKIFLESVGGGSNTPMGFEFVVPKNLQPFALYVKGVRISLGEFQDDGSYSPRAPFSRYARIEARDEAIRSGALLSASTVAVTAELDKSKATPWRPSAQGSPEVVVANSIPMTLVLQKGNTGSLRLDEKNNIISGDETFYTRDVGGGRGLEKSLRVERLLVDSTTVIVAVDVSVGSPFDLLSTASSNAEGPPTLVDNLSRPQRHQCVGWVYQDATYTKIRYTPGEPISDKGELPALTRSRTDQKLILIFRCSLGVNIEYFAIGNTAIKQFAPLLKLENAQHGG
ncbi:MAG: hypothetical protein AB7K52_02275 [Phycisphaerales bacterium]